MKIFPVFKGFVVMENFCENENSVIFYTNSMIIIVCFNRSFMEKLYQLYTN
jgi:hypothetical protein